MTSSRPRYYPPPSRPVLHPQAQYDDRVHRSYQASWTMETVTMSRLQLCHTTTIFRNVPQAQMRLEHKFLSLSSPLLSLYYQLVIISSPLYH